MNEHRVITMDGPLITDSPDSPNPFDSPNPSDSPDSPDPSDPSDPSDPFLEALKFLRNDSTHRATLTEKHIADSTSLVKSVKSAVLVATFVAGVQAQIIALTANQNDTPIQVAANAIGFLGLICDILGAKGGVNYVSILRQAISQGKTSSYTFMDTENLDGIEETLRNASKENQKIPQSTAERLLKEMNESKTFWTFRRMLFTTYNRDLEKHLSLLFPREQASPKRVCAMKLWVVARLSTHSIIRVGVIFLLMSSLLFAGYSQPKPVWITSLVFAVYMSSSCFWATDIVIPLDSGSVLGNLKKASKGIVKEMDVQDMVEMSISVLQTYFEYAF